MICMENVSGGLDTLKVRVEQTKFEDITPGLKARVSCEMVKDALNNKKITPEAASNFASSLIYEPIVPVTIGIPDRKLFPIEQIIEARPLIIQQMREQAKNDGIDFDVVCLERSKKATQVLSKLERDYTKSHEQIAANFGPFAGYLSGDQISEETQRNLQTLNFARQAFSGTEQVPDDDNVIERFVQTDLPNVYFGKDLLSFIENQSLNSQ
jgi:hypothetical protein